MALSHSTLESYYTTLFSMAQHHKYSLTELEDLIPFERDLYAEMLMNHIKQLEEAKQR